ncbi:CpsB/CapC family capsule biosynthesis tyrosine phosphatase [Nonlabens sp.]|uniref:tyrosine-protein phosphatase n=1 Tax=Nonlabens sp. TaxID=1888209 RepID=UPI001BCF1EE8|nr:CpsB/CapC family capsule biosynthesis tyrosine phosphatase [Nonlabens sp.]
MIFFHRSVYLIDFLEGITDIHNHLLPGIDDGAPDLETTINMIQAMKDIGVRNAIATPHTMEDYYQNDVASITANFQETTKALEATAARGFIRNAASEYMMDGQWNQLIEEGAYLCLHKNYLLTELSYFQRPDPLETWVFKMCQKGLIPILAHPERYAYLHSVNRLTDLKNRGFELQLNLLSLSDHYGEQVHAKAISLLDKGLYEYLGTDAHHLTHLEKIKNIKIKKKHLPSLKKLVEHHKQVFDL